MKEKITFNDLILFVFNETQITDTVRVARAIENDLRVRNSFEEITDVLSAVKGECVNPSAVSVKRILSHA